ncbi:MAG: hypothetical protein JXQ74_03075 [Alphaproteobacteria bacterium]|nr:hypothetical protein [Alphaproteobacteria bacterium]
MKKYLIIFVVLLFSATGSEAILGALLGGGGGGALIGTATNLITGKIQEKKMDDYKNQISCIYGGQKVAGWDGTFMIPELDLETARKQYYAGKNQTGPSEESDRFQEEDDFIE